MEIQTLAKSQPLGSDEVIEYLNPAAYLIRVVGGVKSMSEITGVSKDQVWRWTQLKEEKKGTGGRIPGDHPEKILKYARKHDLPIDEKTFFKRGKEPSLKALKPRKRVA